MAWLNNYGNQEFVDSAEYAEWVVVERKRMRELMRKRRAESKARGVILPHYPAPVVAWLRDWLDQWIARQGWITQWGEPCELSDVADDARETAHGERLEGYDFISSRGVGVYLRSRGVRITRTGRGMIVRGIEVTLAVTK